MDLTTRAGRKEQGQRIMKAAEEADLSLEELARSIGCSRALLYQYVSGGVLAQSSRLQKIAERTGRTLAYFFEDQPSGMPAAAGARDEPAERQVSLPPAAEGPVEELAPAVRRPLEDPSPLLTPPLITSSPMGAESQEVAQVSLRYLEELADVQESYGDSQGLLSTCERMVPYARQLGDREREARAWLRIGNARIQRGHQDLALPALRVALSMLEEMGNLALALAARQSIGRARLSAGDTEGAMVEFQKVANGPTWSNRWQGTISLAAVHEHRGKFREALACCEAAAEMIESASGVPLTAVEMARSYVLSNQANVYLALGDFTDTLRITRELLRSAERSNSREQFVEGLINLGICQVYQGEWDQAEENLLRAIDLARFSGDHPRWGFARAWLAMLLCLLGDVEKAKEEAKDALHTGLETASRRCEIQAQLSLGEAYLKASAPREALYHLGQALQVSTTSSSIVQQTLALHRRAAARSQSGDQPGAMEDCRRALKDAHAFGIQQVEAMLQEQIARLHASQDEIDEAIEMAGTALQTARRLGLADLYWRTCSLMASLLDRQDKTEEAIKYGSEAIATLDRLRGRVLVQRGEEALLENPAMLAPFQQQTERLLRAGRPEEAESLVEEAQWPPLSDWFAALRSS